MKDKHPEIYKNKIDKSRFKFQKEYYVSSHNQNINDERTNNPGSNVDKASLLKKINNIFLRPDYVYQADVNIMYKTGETINKKIVGIRDNYLITMDDERISIDDILDVK